MSSTLWLPLLILMLNNFNTHGGIIHLSIYLVIVNGALLLVYCGMTVMCIYGHLLVQLLRRTPSFRTDRPTNTAYTITKGPV